MYREYYNEEVSRIYDLNVLDVGKSKYWYYGFSTIDIDPKLEPTYIGNIERTDFKDKQFDVVLCNGMYECVDNPQKMVDECLRIGEEVIFGFVGKDYKPYKKDWKYYDDNIDFHGTVKNRKDFNNEYHFILCNSR